MQRNHERTAWLVLWGAFIVFALGLISVPSLATYLVFTSDRTLTASATLSGGTVLLNRPDAVRPEALIDVAAGLAEDTRIETATASQSAIFFDLPNGPAATNIASIQLYGDTNLTLDRFRTPRFQFSDRQHRVNLSMSRGRIRVDIAEPPTSSRNTFVIIDTPQSQVLLERPGSYAIEVDAAETQVFVRAGIAVVVGAGESLILGREERTIIPANSPPTGPQSGERNLIENGSFAQTLSNGWSIFKNRSAATAAPGEITVAEFQGRRALHFARFDDNWAELGIRQEINRDIRDLQSLRLQLDLWIAEQSLYNCGALGSECPVMIRLEYTDITGFQHELLQGFYYNAAPAGISPEVPTRCVTCPAPTGDHLQVQRGVWFLYDSDDLLARIRESGIEPVRLDAITIYASGHRFESYITAIALLAED